MKNLVLTFLLALLVVLTALSARRMVAGGSCAAGSPSLVAIGGDPVPPLTPPPTPPPQKPSN
jgi:hypothetical protein